MFTDTLQLIGCWGAAVDPSLSGVSLYSCTHPKSIDTHTHTHTHTHCFVILYLWGLKKCILESNYVSALWDFDAKPIRSSCLWSFTDPTIIVRTLGCVVSHSVHIFIFLVCFFCFFFYTDATCNQKTQWCNLYMYCTLTQVLYNFWGICSWVFPFSVTVLFHLTTFWSPNIILVTRCIQCI